MCFGARPPVPNLRGKPLPRINEIAFYTIAPRMAASINRLDAMSMMCAHRSRLSIVPCLVRTDLFFVLCKRTHTPVPPERNIMLDAI
jgi:hypothetical protein